MAKFRPRRYSSTLVFGGAEITKRGTARFDWRDPYYIAVSLTWPRFFLSVLLADLTINLMFAGLYLLEPGSITNAPPESLRAAFFFSTETLATVGYGVMAPATLYGHIISSIEIFCGLVFTAIMTGLIFVRFSRPKSKIMFADKVVVARHNGVPTLMVRIGNGRVMPLTSVNANLSVIQEHRTIEGHSYRGGTTLKLERAHLPVFAVTWTLMHRLTAESPLADITPENLAERLTSLLLTIEARDQALGAQVYGSRYYETGDILLGMRYQDAVISDVDGHVLADMTRLSMVEPDTHASPLHVAHMGIVA